MDEGETPVVAAIRQHVRTLSQQILCESTRAGVYETRINLSGVKGGSPDIRQVNAIFNTAFQIKEARTTYTPNSILVRYTVAPL
jgi:hypothetical protein